MQTLKRPKGRQHTGLATPGLIVPRVGHSCWVTGLNKPVPTAVDSTVSVRDATVATSAGDTAGERLSSFWYQPAAGEETLNAIAVPGARIWLVFLTLAWLWVLSRNDAQPGVLELFTILLFTIAALSSRRIRLSAKTRLVGIAGTVVLIAETAFLNNGDVIIGTMMVMPAAVVITTAFGARWGGFWLILINGAMLWQAYAFEFHPIDYILRMVPLAMVWSILISVWTVLLVRQSEGTARRIRDLRENERKLYSTLNYELAEPIGILTRLDPSKPLGPEDLERFQMAIDGLGHTLDGLGPLFEVSPGRPPAMDTFCPATLVAQLRVQHAPAAERWSKTLIADASDSARSLVRGDLFRLRIILSNVLRTAAMLSDGSSLWLNVRGEQQQADDILITFDVETNGHPLNIDSLDDMLNEEQDADRGWGHSLAGLRLAQLWCRELGGNLELFKSPRGGNGFRVSNVYTATSDDS